MTVVDLAPVAFEAWGDLLAAVSATTPPELLGSARAVVGGTFATSVGSGKRSAAVAFGEQVVIDVASLSDEVRAAGLAELGESAVGYVLAIWTEDMTARANRAFCELLGEEPLEVRAAGSAENLWAAHGRFLAEVAKLDGLDPITTELVRLRGARAHACRLCQSRRNVTAIDAADHPDLFEDENPTGLTEAQTLALRVVDTFVWQPMHWPSDLGARTVTALGPAVCAELVLDIVRNAANKIAVALAADAPHVDTGVEYFAIDPSSGELIYDLRPR